MFSSNGGATVHQLGCHPLAFALLLAMLISMPTHNYHLILTAWACNSTSSQFCFALLCLCIITHSHDYVTFVVVALSTTLLPSSVYHSPPHQPCIVVALPYHTTVAWYTSNCIDLVLTFAPLCSYSTSCFFIHHSSHLQPLPLPLCWPQFLRLFFPSFASYNWWWMNIISFDVINSNYII